MKKVGSVIAPIVREFGMEEAVRFEAIRKDWQSIFNEPLSLHMYPSRLSKGELLINVDSPLWLQQISFLKTQIVQKLASFGVRDVRFRIGKAPAVAKKSSRSLPVTRPPLEGAALQQIEDTVSVLRDSSIKESIRKVMEKSFASRNRE